MANFREVSDGWEIELSAKNLETREDKRLCAAALLLCTLDIAIELHLRKGKTVHRKVFRESKANSGPYRASEQILPLLLPSDVVDDHLYNYQREGVEWLLRQNRAILGDDMGLGKTAQAIAATRRLIRNGAASWALIVAPRTLLANWCAEINAWAPELTTEIVTSLKSDQELRWAKLIKRAHILVTSYEQIRSPAEVLIRNPPDLIIADEAHRLRKSKSLATRGLRRIKSDRFWALTGTPLERNSEDLVVLLSMLDSSKFSFDDRLLSTTALRAVIRPYFLRRRKADLLKELPEVIEHDELLELNKEQKDEYVSAIQKHHKNSETGNFLSLFNQLLMLCDVEPKTGSSAKLDRVMELITDITDMEEKVVIFSYKLKPIELLQDRLRQANIAMSFSMLTGQMTLQEREHSLSEFKLNPKCGILLASTRVASEGLTLTVANHVIFINQWWNPSSNSQAKDRVIRIGQSKTVTVKSFICRNTIEDRLQQILQKKSLTFDELVDALSLQKIDSELKDKMIEN